MRLFRILASLLALAALSACTGATQASYEVAAETRASGTGASAAAESPYSVRAVRVEVPDTLTASDANEIKPRVDIVWHGDPEGDRYEQVDRIMTAALEQGVASMRGPKPVVLDVTVTRFHAVTPRTRERNPFGEHEIAYTYQLHDARTGTPVGEARSFNGSFRSYYGTQARQAEARGVTQKVRITNFVAQGIAEEMSGG